MNECIPSDDEIRKLWEDYHKDCHKRVPIIFDFDEQFLLPLFNCSFKNYYTDVKTQVDIQLKSQKWIKENIIQDREKEFPEVWEVTPPSWMDENEFFGAEIVSYLTARDYVFYKYLAPAGASFNCFKESK